MFFQSDSHKTFAIAAIGLAIIQGAAFALVSPYDTLPDTVDHWFYPYLGDRIWREMDVFYSFSGRQFSTWGLALSQGLFPGSFASIFYFHVVSLWVFALTIYLVISRLFPQNKLFAFLSAAVYLIYIPTNSEHILYWLELYSWAMMFGGLAAVAFLEYSYRANSMWLAVACLLAYIAARGYETFVPLLGLIPLLQWIPHQRVKRGVIIGALTWWAAIGVGFLQFMIPYLRGDPSIAYQRSVHVEAANPLENTVRFLGDAFPITTLPYIEAIGFPLLMALGLVAVMFVFRRFFPQHSQLFSARWLGIMALAGLLMTLAGGVGFIYGNLIDVPRAQVFAAPGQALLIVALCGLIAHSACRVLRVPQMVILGMTLAAFVFISGQWFFAHDALYGANSTTQRRAPYRALIELVPGVEDETLLLNFMCVTRPRQDPYHNEFINGFAARYLYDYTGGTQVQMAVLEFLTFDETGVTFADRIITDPTPPRHYRYDQMLIVACADGGLHIMEDFPPGFAPQNANLNAYNPRIRITAPRISDAKLNLLNH
jgi:hypothetical protein